MSMPEVREFEINGRRYQIGILDVPTQWRIAKRILAGIAAMSRAQEAEPAPPDAGASEPPAADPEVRKLAILVFVRQALVEMSDADNEMVMKVCLNVVRRFDENAGGGSWRPVLASGAGIQLRDGDIDLNEMISLVLQVVENNLSNFFFGSGG
jgi:hypothetical protein